MRLWPWAKLETRQQDYTDVVVANMLAAASGDVAAGMTAAREIATGALGTGLCIG